MTSGSNKIEIQIDGKTFFLSNLEKVFWKQEGFTKDDVINYYLDIAELILPYLRNRLQVLHRNPNGIDDNGFYQKNVIEKPTWIKTYPVKRETDGKIINYVICDDKATLIYLINLGCIELNPWSSQVGQLNYPDYAIIDLDPLNISFENVIDAAQAIKEVLDGFNIKSYCKTSGKKGLHILIPLGANYTFDQSRKIAKRIVHLTHLKLPEITSLERLPINRNKKVYLDFLQNSFGQTIAAPYSLRPYKAAGVSTPLKWSEISAGLNPADFNIKTVKSRFVELGDLFSGILNPEKINITFDLEKIIELV